MTDEDDLSNDPQWRWLRTERLHRAAAAGDLERIRRLLREGCDIDAFDEDLPYTPLHYAALENQLDAMRCLIEAGANVNAADETRIGNTPLREIAVHCSFEIAKLLVEAGADPTIPGWMQITALDETAAREDAEGRQVHRLLCDTAKRLRVPFKTSCPARIG